MHSATPGSSRYDCCTWDEGSCGHADEQRRQDGLQQRPQQRQRRQRHARGATPQQRRQHELQAGARLDSDLRADQATADGIWMCSELLAVHIA